MSIFLDWLAHRDILGLLRLLEAAEYFNPQDYNGVFEKELEKLLSRIPDSEARQQAAEMQGFDWGNYISRSLQRAGFKDDDQQEAFHEIAIRLLVSPGRLFAGWQPERHGPLESRFRNSVWNAIRNVAEKARHRRKWMQTVDPNVMAGQYAGRSPFPSLIDEFRQLVGQRLGKLALAILDQKLSGEEAKDLVRSGTANAYIVKRETAEIKRLAQEFASGDAKFLYTVNQALEQEAETAAKRRQTAAARQAG